METQVPIDALKPNSQRLRPEYLAWRKVKDWYWSGGIPGAVSAGCARMLKDLRGQENRTVCIKLRKHADLATSRSAKQTYRNAALIIECGWMEWPGLDKFKAAKADSE